MSSDPERWRLLAAVVEIEPEFLEQCVRCGAIQASELPEGDTWLAPAQLSRLRRLERLSRGLEIDIYAAGVIVGLLERMEILQAELDRARGPERKT